ncbi:MAG: collagen-binding domain-containing protein, partial [Myxococcota bacterium]
MFVLLVGLAQPALATGPSYQAFPGVCDPYQPSNYEMVDYNGHRTIWGRKLFCDGNALFSAIPGQNTLHLTDKPHPNAHIPNPGSMGSFTGTFELVEDGCGPHDTPTVPVQEHSIWHVSYQVAAPESNTDHKGTRNVEDEYQLGLVRNGTMTSGDFSITFDNKPGDDSKGHQIGFGANDKETHDFGGAFWFYWNLFENGHHRDNGHGDFNFDLQCITPPSGCPTDGGLGLDGFGVYVCDDFTAQNSDSQGAMAIGGDATFFNYGVASQSDNGNGIGLTVGGNLDAFNAQVYNGLAEAGTCDRGPHNPTTDHTPSFNVLNGSLTCDVNDAGPDCSTKCEVADYLSSLNDTNCHVTIQPWGQIDINVTGDDAVCTIDTDDAVNTFQWVWNNWINGISVNGNHPDTVIINIKGSQDIWGKNGQMWLNGVDQEAVVWNLGCNNGVCDN